MTINTGSLKEIVCCETQQDLNLSCIAACRFTVYCDDTVTEAHYKAYRHVPYLTDYILPGLI